MTCTRAELTTNIGVALALQSDKPKIQAHLAELVQIAVNNLALHENGCMICQVTTCEEHRTLIDERNRFDLTSVESNLLGKEIMEHMRTCTRCEK